MIKELNGHEGLVKGLAWDPIGKYLASFGDDKRLILWNTSNWEIHTTITEPFEKKVDALAFRLSWTPEGGCLVCPGTMNGKSYVASLISRKDFKTIAEFKGHKCAIVITKVNPKMFKKDGNQIAYLALGDQGGNVFIYSTDSEKEKIYLKNLFKESVSEISWSSDGLRLFVSSLGGTVLEFSFNSEFFGQPISQTEIQTQLNEQYGEVGNNFSLIEDVSFSKQSPLSMRFEQPQAVPRVVQEIKPPSQPVVKRTEPIIQTETIKDGKKRIKPMLIQKASPQQQQPIFAPEPIEVDAPNFPPQEVVKIVETVQDTSKNFEKVVLKRKKNNDNEVPYKRVKGDNLMIQISNNHELRCTKEGNVEFLENSQVKWKRSYYQTIQTAACNSKYIVIASSHSVIILNHNGHFIISPFTLETAFLALNQSNHLAILTKDLTYYQWDLETKSLVISTSIQPLLSKSEDLEVDDIGLNTNNIIIITLSSGESYSYHPTMKIWICIADSQFIMSSLLGKSYQGIEEYSLSKLKEKAYQKITELKISTPLQNVRDTFGDLEKAIKASEVLGDSKEFLKYVKMYTQQISHFSDSNRLIDLCQDLLEERKIGDTTSYQILKECLEIISNSKLQRIVTSYKTILKELQE